MTHDELLAEIDRLDAVLTDSYGMSALRAVVELHKPDKIPDWVPTKKEYICWCAHIYPCPTIQAIEKELG
jgi:hypothetical protein